MWFFRRKSKKPTLFDRAMADQHQRHVRIIRELIEIMDKKIIDSIDKNYLSASFLPYEQGRRIMPDMLKVMAAYYEKQGFTVHYSVMEESSTQSHRPHIFTVRWPEPKTKNIAKENLHGSTSIRS
jgi:hypothetical protein